MKKPYLTILLIIYFAMIAASCEVNTDPPADCTASIDSVNNHWIGVIRNLNFPDPPVEDTVYVMKDSVIINWKDSTRWTLKDSVIINWKDSTRWTFRDSVIVDTIVTAPASYEIPIRNVKVDSSATEMIAANLVDGILYNSNTDRGTRFGVPGYPHQIMLQFDSVYTVTEIWVNIFGWDEGYTHTIDVFAFADKHERIRTDGKNLWSKHKLNISASHLYLDIISGENSWTDIGEIIIYGYRNKTK